MKEKKILQIVNLSPSEDWIEKIVEIHPMKQIVWASIVQACVFGFMLLSFLGISIATEANDFDFEQMKKDATRIQATEFSMDFNIENPQHKYFLAINILDMATTIYAMENRDNLKEKNPLLPERPEIGDLVLHKTLVIYSLKHLGLFSTNPKDEWNLPFLNVVVSAAVLNNMHKINTYD
tara:strand:+ start:19 stop:555 length:537 start_codon:yes stop_codon:yes gene_type:complete